MSKDTTQAIIGQYEQHPIAVDLMPGGMTPEEFDALCADVEARGVLMPVTIYEGKVLDGWHRYRAAQKTGSAFKTINYTGKDPAGYIASVNVLRRRLSSLQRALVGARLHTDHGLTQRDVCKKLGISNEVVTLVLKAITSKNTKLIKRIEDDSDFTRGMLKEELTDAGLMRSKPAEPTTPTGPNSVFAMGASTPGKVTVSDAAANMVTDGIGDDEDVDDILGGGSDPASTGKGKAAADRAARKPRITPAQALSDEFKALMYDEKLVFLQMIWPEAKSMVAELKLTLPAAPKKTASKKAA